MLIDLVTVAVLAFVGSRLLSAAGLIGRREVRDHIRRIVSGVRPGHVLMAIPVLTAVAVTASLLLEVPGLDFGWWTAIGGEGNPVVGSTDRTRGTVLEWLIPLVFLVLLMPALPLFAEREERMFRVGAENWTPAKRIRRGIEFGLVHAIIGIPIGVALALAIGGWYFTWAHLRGYRRGGPPAALMESTRAHFAYNAVVVAVVAVILVVSV